MFRWQSSVGAALGFAAGCAILALAGSGSVRLPPASGPILSECDGHLRELVLHYEPSASHIVTNVYRDFLQALEEDVVVRVVCPSQAAFAELAGTVGKLRCQFTPVVVNHPMTTWSRDRWVALAPASGEGPTTILSPRGEAGDLIWPARAGDELVGADLAAAVAPAVAARRSSLYFDGGDFLADGANVFVMPRVLHRNLQRTVRDADELLAEFQAQLRRPIALLPEAPDHHAAMFMVAAGHRRMLVGDPALGRKLADADAWKVFETLPGGADFTPETQRLFDSVAAQCTARGYAVTRIPTVPANDGRTFLTYCNVLVDEQAGRRIVYLPAYAGAESLDTAARAVWEQLGCEVRQVDCTSAFRHFGCLHCLVNVLRRS